MGLIKLPLLLLYFNDDENDNDIGHSPAKVYCEFIEDKRII